MLDMLLKPFRIKVRYIVLTSSPTKLIIKVGLFHQIGFIKQILGLLTSRHNALTERFQKYLMDADETPKGLSEGVYA